LNSGRDATNLFEEQTASDLQVGALITGLSVKGCIHAVLKATLQGSATMDVEWQVYSVSQGKVVARIATHGGFSAGGLELGNVTPVVTGVFADTVRRLAANAQFRELITAPTAVAVAPKSVMLFTPATGSVRIADAAKGVVVIYAGDGQGSGILISPDGYILTNHHVAGGSGRVRVRWSDGTESIGEVLRSDPRRDVALIRTSGKSTALSIRHEPPVLGETVFAIGTPLEKEFQNTLTRGVVSGNRTIEGQPFIQSDVAVDHGNSGGPLLDEQGRVLALTDWGYAPDGVSHNLNFFIPIDDALRALGLSPAAEPPPQKAAAR
jgi:S1-C subfamily serine protease